MKNEKIEIFGCSQITKIVNEKNVIQQITLEVKTSQIVALLGPNGAGKTTTFAILTGIIYPSSGTVYINNTKITTLPMYQRARLGIGYLPQESSIFQDLTVEQNIFSILEYHHKSRKKIKQITYNLLREFNLFDMRTNKASVLSGGERRKLEIARALSIEPKFLLLDEPFAGIDPLAIEDVKKIILDLKNRNIGVLITDHNVRETVPITDYIYVVYSGKILAHAKSEEIINNNEAKVKYFGNIFD